MGLSEIFKHRKTNRKVIYKDICTFESIEEEETTDYGITFNTRKEDIQTCILCEDFDTHAIYAIPIIQFMNYYEPTASMVEEMMDAVEKLKNAENEGNKENIHTLYGRKSEVEPGIAPE